MTPPNRVPVLTPGESTAVREFLEAVRTMLGGDLKEVRLFGSRARGEGNENSDLDIALIVSPSGRTRRYEVYDVAYDVGLRHGILLAPTVITSEAFDEMRRRELRFALDLEREGIRL